MLRTLNFFKLSKVLRLAVLLPKMASCPTNPMNLVYYNYMEKVLPAIYLASNVGNNNTTSVGGYKSPLNEILPGWKFQVWHGDTECSSTSGPIESFQLHCLAGQAIPWNTFGMEMYPVLAKCNYHLRMALLKSNIGWVRVWSVEGDMISRSKAEDSIKPLPFCQCRKMKTMPFS